MKLLTVILSFYIFALSAIPCVDAESENTAHAVSEKSGKDDHSHKKDNDLCSPFCICSCCGQVMLSFNQAIVYDFHVQFEEIKTTNPLYTSAMHSNFYGSIWQPPQIV